MSLKTLDRRFSAATLDRQLANPPPGQHKHHQELVHPPLQTDSTIMAGLALAHRKTLPQAHQHHRPGLTLPYLTHPGMVALVRTPAGHSHHNAQHRWNTQPVGRSHHIGHARQTADHS